MKSVLITLLKVLLVVAVAWFVYHAFPLIMAPLAALAATLLVVGGLLSGGLLAVGALCLAVVIPLLLAFLALVGLTSPLWLTILAVIGLIALCRGGARRPA